MKKLYVLLFMVFIGFASIAQSPQSINANLSPSSQTFNHPNPNGNNAPNSLSGYVTPFHAFVFTASVTGTYYFEANNPSVDNFGVLYTFPFNPAQPLTNAIVANDGSSFNPGDNYLIARNLTAGTTYVLVTTTFYLGEYGNIPVTITGPFTTPLPVEMSDLMAHTKNQGVELTWTTYSEVNSKGFYIQKSTNGRDFVNIAYLNSTAEGKNVATNYFYQDVEASAINFYRIAQEDVNGRISYSNIVKATLDSKLSQVDVYPNPSSDAVTIFYALNKDAQVRMQLVDMNGRIVYNEQTNKAMGSQQSNLNIGHLACGQYALRLYISGNKVYSGLIKKQ